MDQHQSVKEEIKRVADIVEVIGKFVQLKQAGQNLLGLCPFHAEKTPSFTVSPSKQIFHCFGCRKGGDVFTFWMDYHKITFPEAIRDLAERYQISLPKGPWSSSETEKWSERATLIKINELACAYFQEKLLRSEKGNAARTYLAGRGMVKEIVSRFRIGYAPDDWNGISRILKGQDLECACKVGLVIPRKNEGYYDRFRGRVIFPIFDVSGRILGFGGRVLDDSTPKYMNTPESPLFHKGRILYGFQDSHEAIRRSGRAVIVEGYMDFLSLKRHGFNEVVATLGTALTREHIRTLRGYAKEAVVVFDSDAAGRAAASKTLPVFLDEEFPARAILLPENEDPDSFVNGHGLPAFQDLLTRAPSIFDFFVDLQLAQVGDSIESRLGILKQIVPLLCDLKNAAQQSLYVRRLAQKLDLYESSILEEMRKRLSSASWKEERNSVGFGPIVPKPKSKDETIFLNILVHHPSAIESLMNEDFRILLSEGPAREIFDRILESYRRGTVINISKFVETADDEQSREMLREVLVCGSICRDEEVEQAISQFHDKVLKIKLAESKNKALENGDLQELSNIPKIKRREWG